MLGCFTCFCRLWVQVVKCLFILPNRFWVMPPEWLLAWTKSRPSAQYALIWVQTVFRCTHTPHNSSTDFPGLNGIYALSILLTSHTQYLWVYTLWMNVGTIVLYHYNWAATWDFQQRGTCMCDQQSLRSAWSESLIVAWVFYECLATDWTSLGVSKLKKRLRRLVWVYTCQNTTLLEITCHGSIMSVYHDMKWIPRRNSVEMVDFIGGSRGGTEQEVLTSLENHMLGFLKNSSIDPWRSNWTLGP